VVLKPFLDFAFFSVVKNPFDLRSQIRVRILKKKNTAYATGYEAMNRIFYGFTSKSL